MNHDDYEEARRQYEAITGRKVVEEPCKDLSTSLQEAITKAIPAVTDASGDTIQSTNSGEHGSPETSQSAEFADPITRLALEAMREAENDPNVQTCDLLMALSTSGALRGVSNKEAELRAENERLMRRVKAQAAEIKRWEMLAEEYPHA